MSERTGLALRLLGVALGMGLLGNWLLRTPVLGLNVGLWVAALVAGLAGMTLWRGVPLTGGGRWLVAPGLAFAFAFAWRDSVFLGLANLIALAACVALAVCRSREGRIAVATLADYAWDAFRTALIVPLGAFFLVAGDVKWSEMPPVRRAGGIVALGRGLVVAAPVLLVFGALFASADPIFSRLVADIFDWDLDELVAHLWWIGFWGAVAGGLARQALLGGFENPIPDRQGHKGWIEIVETATVLGAVDLLFLAFLAVQGRYFFGGADLVQATAGMTYAEYARRGFFELVAVAALVLPLLVSGDWLLRREKRRDERLFTLLAGALVVMVFLVLGSALLRMRLYQEEFGMTELRLYTTVFMAWLAAVFAWFAATVLRARRDRFPFGALVSGLLLVAGLNLLNPDAYIVATNVDRLQAGKTLDAPYAVSLSADAVPKIVSALPAIPEAERKAAATLLLKRWSRPPDSDPRVWNWGRQEAWTSVGENSEMLRGMAAHGE